MPSTEGTDLCNSFKASSHSSTFAFLLIAAPTMMMARGNPQHSLAIASANGLIPSK